MYAFKVTEVLRLTTHSGHLNSDDIKVLRLVNHSTKKVVEPFLPVVLSRELITTDDENMSQPMRSRAVTEFVNDDCNCTVTTTRYWPITPDYWLELYQKPKKNTRKRGRNEPTTLMGRISKKVRSLISVNPWERGEYIALNEDGFDQCEKCDPSFHV